MLRHEGLTLDVFVRRRIVEVVEAHKGRRPLPRVVLVNAGQVVRDATDLPPRKGDGRRRRLDVDAVPLELRDTLR